MNQPPAPAESVRARAAWLPPNTFAGFAVAVLAAAHGADLVRVHDVEATVRALKVADAIVREPVS